MIFKDKTAIAASRWSGGTTTELFIFPEEASYAARDFHVRISTATVETAVSEFTALPGYERTLLVLEGTLTIVHELEAETLRTELKPFEQAHFKGDWKTTGFGKVTDFNVMLREGYSAAVEVIHLERPFAFVAANTDFRTLLYIVSGILSAEGKQLSAGSVVVLQNDEELHLDALENAVMISVAVVKEAYEAL